MKTGILAALAALMVSGCYQDPRAPLDPARREINDTQTFQLQAQRLLPLQDDLQRALLRDDRIVTVTVGLRFGWSADQAAGTRLVVNYVILLETRPEAVATKDSTEQFMLVQELVRLTLARHGWEVEEVYPYCYGNTWRIDGRIRGAGRPPTAGAGLDLLPGRPESAVQ